jgi:hypothetical protein
MVNPRSAFTSSWTSGRLRTSSQCLQHPLFLDALQAPLQKINLQCLLANLPLQFGDPAFRPALFAVAGESISGPLAELLPPPLQDIRAHLQRAGRFRNRYPLFQPPDGGQLELFRELPSRQSHDSNPPFNEI